jgi:hypothetical protein
MSKQEIVRRLNDASPRLELVQSVQALQQAVSSMNESLADLPAAIETEVTNALEPLGSLQYRVQTAVEAYDQVTTVQRQSLEAMALEMTTIATQAFEERVRQLDTALNALAQRLADLETANEAKHEQRKHSKSHPRGGYKN